jgi:histidinol-phosphatase (PHP family)
MSGEAWRVSLHGGHSGVFCEHAEGTLGEMLAAAEAYGFHTFGVSEHAPRSEARFLYSSEVEKGFDVKRLADDFAAYATEVDRLAARGRGDLVVLRGFEAEVVPSEDWLAQMQAHRAHHRFDYVVGSVHYVDERLIDGPHDEFEAAVTALGGLESLAIRYYETVADMVQALRPEVVGHLDLIRKNAGAAAVLDTAPIRRAAVRALEAVRRHGGILDCNTAGYRKGLGSPYPAPWLVHLARDMAVPFCFGDDSHRPSEVGAGIDEARDYLLANGVSSITVLTRDHGNVVRRAVPLGA